jgi:hypothetical protein
MHRAFAAIFVSTFLASCSSAGTIAGTPASDSAVRQQAPLARPSYEVCGSLEYKHIAETGGTQRLPHIAKQREFYGTFGYGAFNMKGRVASLIFSCPTSDPIAPTPQGYTADWFGSWTLICHDGCNGITFANAGLDGSIVSNVWSQNETYYLYLYTLYTRQFIASYQIGPVTPGKNGRSSLAFASPFENGFVYPTNEAIALEIVHPSP